MRTQREKQLKEQLRLQQAVDKHQQASKKLVERISEFNKQRQRSQKWVMAGREHLRQLTNDLTQALEKPEGW